AVDEMYTQVAEKWLAQQPRMEKVQREFLERALHYYQVFAEDQSTDPAVQLEKAAAYRRMGHMYQKLGEHAKAGEAFGQGVALVAKLAADFPALREYREELASCYSGLGSLQMYTNRLEEAGSSFGKALTIYDGLVGEFGMDTALRNGLAGSHHNLGL